MIDASKATVTREPHAGHYVGGGGHDLEWIDVAAPTRAEIVNVPGGFEYHSGYRDREQKQHWMFCRIAPLSPGSCHRCKDGKVIR